MLTPYERGEISIARYRGKRAARERKQYKNNPYPHGTMYYRAWLHAFRTERNRMDMEWKE